MPSAVVPLARPVVNPSAVDAVADVLRSGQLVQGTRVADFEGALADATGYRHAVVVSSGTAALYLALRALGVGSGDRVLCPALSWPSPAHAACLVGAELALVDVDRATWNSEPENYRTALSALPRAQGRSLTIAIDQFGSPADTAGIAATSESELLLDGACSLGSQDPSRPRASLMCLSFHPRKVVTTGEGGACLTDDEAQAASIRCLRNHGQQAPGAFVAPGHNFRLTDFAAAIGCDQLQDLAVRVACRQGIAAAYRHAFPRVQTQKIRPGCSWNAQTFGVVVGASRRDLWIDTLRGLGVQAGPLSYAISRIGSMPPATLLKDACPVAERLSMAGLALPMFETMSEAERDQVIGAVQACLSEHGVEDPQHAEQPSEEGA